MLRIPIFILLSLFTTASFAEPKGKTMPDTTQTAFLSGGCFWGMEDLVRQIPGVLETEVGYTGGEVAQANYEIVKTGRSGHAESLKIVFDPKKLTFRHLLFEFFRMHSPVGRARLCAHAKMPVNRRSTARVC